MKMKQQIILVIFFLACFILSSLLFVYSLNNFLAVTPRGLPKEVLDLLPYWLRGFYKGFPTPIALLGYCLFTLSAFLLMKEKRKRYKAVSMISFVLLVCMFMFFL